MEECPDRTLARARKIPQAQFAFLPTNSSRKKTKRRFALAIAALSFCAQEDAIAQQVVPDNTLGPESSVVIPNANVRGIDSDRIEGGAQRGGNLFHSFQEFNVELDRGVYFSNPDGIDNILTRVTGGDLSNIDGVLGVIGGANLFLINPNGILFGPAAQLDLSGSFVGSTAESILFEEFEFSAADPSAPPLLTVNVPIGLQIGPSPEAISVRSQTLAPFGGGASLTLIGGDIRLEGSSLVAPGADVWLGGLAAAGVVELDSTLAGAQVPTGVLRADVTLTDGAQINVASDGGGSVTAIANDLSLEGGSFIFAGIVPGGTSGNTAGDVAIDATGAIVLQGENQGFPSSIFNQVSSSAVGNSGGIIITADSLSLMDGTFLSTNTLGSGNAGFIQIQTSGTVTLQGEDSQGNASTILSLVQAGATGNSGGIEIEAGNLLVAEGALLNASTSAVGDAGPIRIQADDAVTLQGATSQGAPSAILSSVQPEAMGDSGGIEIEAGSLSIFDGTAAIANTLGMGDAGLVQIRTSGAVTLAGENGNGVGSSIASQVQNSGIGNSVGIDIETGSLALSDGAFISATTLGQGSAGEIQVRAAEAVTLQGESSNLDDGGTSQILSQVFPEAEGSSGGIFITAESLSLLDGALLTANTFGLGDAGTIEILTSDSTTLQGEDSQGFPSRILSQVEAGAIGNSLGIEIEADTFSLNDGTSVSAITSGQGNAGLIQVRAADAVVLQGESSTGTSISNILSQVASTAVGNSGGIEIEADSLSLSDGALLSATTLGEGNAGLIQVRTSNVVTLQGEDSQGFASTILSQVQGDAVGNSEGIVIEAGSLSLNDGALLNANTFGTGDAGEIRIRTSGAVTLQGESSIGSFGSTVTSQVLEGATGSSGDIVIEAGSLSLFDNTFLTASTSGSGDAGEIRIRTSGAVILQGAEVGSNIASQVTPTAAGNAAGIDVEAGNLALIDGGQLNSITLGEGSAGNIAVRTNDAIVLQGESNQGNRSGIFSTVEAGAGGDDLEASGSISLLADTIALQENAAIEVDSQGIAPGGDIDLTSHSSLELSDRATVTAAAASNQGGNVELQLQEDLILRENSFISAEAGTAEEGIGQGGTLDIDARFVVAFPGNNDLNANAFNGPGGSIEIETEGLFGLELRDLIDPRAAFTNDITVSSQLEGAAGTFELVSPEVDPSKNLAVLPVETLNVASLIDRRCALTASDAVGRFAIVGRGGLPPDPRSPLASSPILPDFGTDGTPTVALPPKKPSRSRATTTTQPTQVAMVEARGWHSDASGRVWLTGSAKPAAGRVPSECRKS